MAAGKHRDVRVTFPVPAGLPAGSRTIKVCADTGHQVPETSESDNCGRVGAFTLAAPTTRAGVVPISPPVPVTTVPPAQPLPYTVPANPIAYPKASVFTLNDSLGNYWVYVPSTYDGTHQTPTKLLVWLHGCQANASDDINHVSPGGSQDWISIAVGGREGQCWDVDHDDGLVFAAINDLKTHFNINPRTVVLGGYSSGGNLAYRTAFYHALSFAGVLILNSSPFSYTDSTESASLAASAWKFNITHLAHLEDSDYPIAMVRSETNELASNGYPIQRIEVQGTHHDEPGDVVNGHPVPGTFADLATYLLPKMDAGWQAPAS